MPLTRKGRKIKKAMQKEYGKKKGTRVFFAWENTPNGRRIMRGKK